MLGLAGSGDQSMTSATSIRICLNSPLASFVKCVLVTPSQCIFEPPCGIN